MRISDWSSDVCSSDLIDELSLAGGNEVAVVTPEGVRMQRSEAADAGLPTRPISDIRGGDATYNARALRALLMGEPGPYRDAALYTAAEALVVAGPADHPVDGVEDAAEAIDRSAERREGKGR